MVIKQDEKIPFELSPRERGLVALLEKEVDAALKSYLPNKIGKRDCLVCVDLKFDKRIEYALQQRYGVAGWNTRIDGTIGAIRVYE